MDKQIVGLSGSPKDDFFELLKPSDEQNGTKKDDILPSYDFQPIRPIATGSPNADGETRARSSADSKLSSSGVIEDQQLVSEELAEPSTKQPCISEPSHDEEENARPPSEWLEDTLIIELASKVDGVDMAEIGECKQKNESQRSESFVWDEKSKLYFHMGSGFYYEPNAGWYFSSRDGLYYTYEDGNYVLLESNKVIEDQQLVSEEPAEPSGKQPCSSEPSHDDEVNGRPPSEWLEDTLINLYLMGYPNSNDHMVDTGELGINNGALSYSAYIADVHDSNLSNADENMQSRPGPSGEVANEATVPDEENWRAQYGQVEHSISDSAFGLPVVDLWDWALVVDNANEKKHKLVGRLTKKSVKLHPSMPTGGRSFKTAAISEVHLDLVRVSSGRIYRLRHPSGEYLASLTKYDSANPTKDWGFPDLFQIIGGIADYEPHYASGGNALKMPDHSANGPSLELHDEVDILKKRSSTYRDRAAERRKLYGGFGVGCGHKNEGSESYSPEYSEEASFGSSYSAFAAGSYARQLLERMGWKEGEGLGKTQKGLLQPVQAVGNKGSAGLGWKNDRAWRHVKFCDYV
ncbi:unnamed protein product [Victoria cruziana]